MAWLYEAYEALDEYTAADAIKTANRGLRKAVAAGYVKQDDVNKANSSFIPGGTKESKEGMKAVAKGTAKYLDKDRKEIDKAMKSRYGKHEKLDQIKDTVKAVKGDDKAVERVRDRTVDFMNAKDALDRHNRRHPKAANESVDMFVELMQ